MKDESLGAKVFGSNFGYFLFILPPSSFILPPLVGLLPVCVRRGGARFFYARRAWNLLYVRRELN
jgi:hypothetical protein